MGDSSIYRPNIKVTTDAYSATNKDNMMDSSEWFVFNPVDIYDTKEGRYLGLSAEDLANPETLLKYTDDTRYAILLGESYDATSGFMNISDYFEEAGIEFVDSTIKNDVSGDPVQEQEETTTIIKEEDPSVDGAIGRYTDTGTGGSTPANNEYLGSEAAHKEHIDEIKYNQEQKKQETIRSINNPHHDGAIGRYTDTATSPKIKQEMEANNIVANDFAKESWTVNVPVTFMGQKAQATLTPSDELIVRLADGTCEYRFIKENDKFVLKN